VLKWVRRAGRRKKKGIIIIQKQDSIWQNPLALLAFVGLCALLLYPPYLRALFFTAEQLPTHMLTYVVFILWWVVKYQRKDSSFISKPLDYFVFGFALVYLLSFTVAVNVRGAIQEFLKVSNYFMIYWLVSSMSKEKSAANIILNLIAAAAVGVAVLGLGAAAGTWEVIGGYRNGRIFSTIQYPNSLAAYLTGAFFVVHGVNAECGQKAEVALCNSRLFTDDYHNADLLARGMACCAFDSRCLPDFYPESEAC
jgi:hypothetical protein